MTKKNDKTDLTDIRDLESFDHEDEDSFDFPEDTDIENQDFFENEFQDQSIESEDFIAQDQDFNTPFDTNEEDNLFAIEENDTDDPQDLTEDLIEDTTEELTEDFSWQSESLKNEDPVSEQYQEDLPSLDPVEASPLPPEQPHPDELIENTTIEQSLQQNISPLNPSRSTRPGNPAFSILIKDINTPKQREQLKSILSEHGFFEQDSELYQQAIERGEVLIPRISEFVAIVICHRIKRLNLNSTLAHSHHFSPHEKDPEVGISTKINENFNSDFINDSEQISFEDVYLTPQEHLPRKKILHYRGLISETLIINLNDFENHQKNVDLNRFNAELEMQIKKQAVYRQANAVINIHFDYHSISEHNHLVLTCQGEAVWAIPL